MLDLGLLEHQLRRELELALSVEGASTCGTHRPEWRAGTHEGRHAAVESQILRTNGRTGNATGQLSSRRNEGEGGCVYSEDVCVIEDVEGICPNLEMNLLVDGEIACYP